jgi:hypothetical protein
VILCPIFSSKEKKSRGGDEDGERGVVPEDVGEKGGIWKWTLRKKRSERPKAPQ